MGCRYYQGASAQRDGLLGRGAGAPAGSTASRTSTAICRPASTWLPICWGPICELAQNLSKPDASEAADQCMEQMLASNPEKAEALVVQGRYYLITQRPDLAEKSAHEALALSPNEARSDAAGGTVRCDAASNIAG